jgi:hypothetical protein
LYAHSASAIVAGVGLAITINQLQESLEVDATNYILENYPEKDAFELSMLHWGSQGGVYTSRLHYLTTSQKLDVNDTSNLIFCNRLQIPLKLIGLPAPASPV